MQKNKIINNKTLFFLLTIFLYSWYLLGEAKKESNKQKAITQKALNQKLMTEGLMLGEENKTTIEKKPNNSLDARILSFNTTLLGGKLKDYRFIPPNSKIPEGYAKLDKKRYSYEYESIESNGSLIEHTISIIDNDKNKSLSLWKILATKILEIKILESNKIIVNYREDSNNTDEYNSKIKALDIASNKELDLSKKENQYIFNNIKKFNVSGYKWYEINKTINTKDICFHGKYYDVDGYSISLYPPYPLNDISVQIDKYKGNEIESSYTVYGTKLGYPLSPIIIPDLEVIVLSGVSINNGNYGGEIIIDKMQKNGSNGYEKVVYENKHHLKGIFLTQNKKYVVSYTMNQINITRIVKDKAYMTEINVYVDGVSYLKNDIFAYWHENEITLVEVFSGTYRKIATLDNIIQVSKVFIDNNDDLIVLGDSNLTPYDEDWRKNENKTLGKWDIHQMFNRNKKLWDINDFL